MNRSINSISFLALAMVALAGSAPAFADGSLKDADSATATEARQLKVDWNLGVTSNYVFRGFSQSKDRPALQGGVDLTYGTFYAGLWASTIDFTPNQDFRVNNMEYKADPELDVYWGFKPVAKTPRGDLNFDIGVIAYTYPGSTSHGGNLTYEEGKFGVNQDVWKNGNLSGTFWYSPNYTLNTGSVFTSETTFTQSWDARDKWVPSVSATFGEQWGHSTAYQVLIGNGATQYEYWNAGATMTYDSKVSIDLRYWGTDIKNNNASGTYFYSNGAAGGTSGNYANGFCDGKSLQCGNLFSATVKYTY